MTENTTVGTNSVLNSLKLTKGSVIYHLNTVYGEHIFTLKVCTRIVVKSSILLCAGAVRKSMHQVCQKTGAVTQEESLQFPLESDEAVVELVERTLKPNTSLALFSHIPSNMPFIMPVKKLVKICHDR